jgi:hypothetical protein
MQLKESYTLLDQLMASKVEHLPMSAQRQHMYVAFKAVKLQSDIDMAMIVYVFNTLWVAREVGVAEFEPEFLETRKKMMLLAQKRVKHKQGTRWRHWAAAVSLVVQYGYLLEDLSQAGYVQLHREVDKRTKKNVESTRNTGTAKRRPKT